MFPRERSKIELEDVQRQGLQLIINCKADVNMQDKLQRLSFQSMNCKGLMPIKIMTSIKSYSLNFKILD